MNKHLDKMARVTGDTVPKRKPAGKSNGSRDAYFRTTKNPGPLDVKVDERVAYTRYFLMQVAGGPTDPMWFMRGTVVELGSPWCKVLWDGDDKPTTVSTTALAHP